MTRWAKVKPGDVVELKGAEWTVTKAKRKGDRVRVTVTGKPGTFTRDVDAAGKVRRVRESVLRPGGGLDFGKLAERLDGPLRDASGAQRRWARDDEVTHDKRGATWESPSVDPAGAAVEGILGGVLVAATLDGETYAVPHVDLTTVRAHLSTFHGIPGNEQPLDEGQALALHRELHERADHEPTHAHEHTKRRPA